MSRSFIVKMIISGALSLAALVALVVLRTPFAAWMAVGMLLGTHGDACLSGAPFAKRYPQPFIIGVASFLLGHVCYSIGFAQALSGGFPWLPFLIALLAYTLATLGIWRWATRGNGSMESLLRYGSLGYALVIGCMASFAFAYAWSRGGLAILPAIGGLLFVLSDAIIAACQFGGRQLRHSDAWIWATYVPAQVCVLLAVWVG